MPNDHGGCKGARNQIFASHGHKKSQSPVILGLTSSHFFGHTARYQWKIQNFSEQTCEIHSRKPHPIVSADCAGPLPHIFRTISAHFWIPPHMFRTNFSGITRECPAHKFCALFSGTWPVLKICLCTGNKCLKVGLKIAGSSQRSQRYSCECECEFWRASRIR